MSDTENEITLTQVIKDFWTLISLGWQNLTGSVFLNSVTSSNFAIIGCFLYIVFGSLFGLPLTGYVFQLWLLAIFVRFINLTMKENVVELRSVVSDVSDTVVDKLITPTTDAIKNVTDSAYNFVSAIDNNSLSLTSITSNLQRHPLGVAACVKAVGSARDWNDLTIQLVQLMSFAGFERSIINMVLGRVAAFRPQLRGEQQNFTEAMAKLKSYDLKKLTGLAGLATSIYGVQVDGKDHVSFLRNAVANQMAIEKAWELVEECLNSLGITSTGKWAYLHELQEKYDLVEPEFKFFLRTLAVTPAELCQPSVYARYQRFRKSLDDLDRICRQNVCPDVKNSKIFMSLQTLITKAISWDTQVQQVRALSGVRPVPVGVCIQGASQLGKSMLASQLTTEVKKKLQALANSDPDRYASFLRASEWSTWNMQVRDEYDEGYGGNEITYVDDCFADKAHKDHPMWLTFISSSCVGTVQARLDQKGAPYQSRLVFASCNNLPTNSTTINNINALWERFPITLGVRLKPGEKRKTTDDDYDPTFSHLEFHVNRMSNHCQLHQGKCQWPTGARASCDAKDMTLEEVVDSIVKMIVSNDRKFIQQVKVVGEFQNDTESEISDDSVSLNGSCGGETDEEILPSPRDLQRIEKRLRDSVNLNLPIWSWADKQLLEIAHRLPSLLSNRSLADDFVEWDNLTGFEAFRTVVEEAAKAKEIGALDPTTETAAVGLGSYPLWIVDNRRQCVYLYGHQIYNGERVVVFHETTDIHSVSIENLMENIFIYHTDDDPETEYSYGFRGAYTLPIPSINPDMSIIARANLMRWITHVRLRTNNTMHMADAYRDFTNYGVNPAFARGRAWRGDFNWRDIPQHIWDGIHGDFEGICTMVRVFFDSIKDFSFWAIAKLGELAQYTLSEILQLWFDLRSANKVALIGTLAIGLLSGLAYTIIRICISANKEEKPLVGHSEKWYHRERQRRGNNNRNKLVKRAFGRAERGQENYYDKDECPFCDEFTDVPLDWFDVKQPQSGYDYSYNGFLVRKPKYPYEGVEGHKLCIMHDAWWTDNDNADLELCAIESGFLGDVDEDSYSDSCPTGSPLTDIRVFGEELKTAMFVGQDQHDGDYSVQRNWGPDSGGSIPHSHIHVYHECDTPKTISGSFLRYVNGRKGDDLVIFEFGFTDVNKELKPFLFFLERANDTIGSLSFVFKMRVLGNLAYGNVVMSISRSRDKATARKLRLQLSELVLAQPSAVLNGEQEGMDDNATTVLNSVATHNLVKVVQLHPERFTLTNRGASDNVGGALGHQHFVVCPAHYGKVGDWYLVIPMGKTPLAQVQEKNYWLAQMVNSNHLTDVGILECLDPTKVSTRYPTWWDAKRYPWQQDAARYSPSFPTLYKHTIPEEQVHFARGTTCAVYLPKTGLTYTGRITSQEVKSYISDSTGLSENFRLTMLMGGNTDSPLSQKGDCGGPAVCLDPRRPNKLLGFHAYAGNSFTGLAYFSTEELQELIRSRVSCGYAEALSESVIVSTKTHFCGPVEASYGTSQLRGWPRVTWAREQPQLGKIAVGHIGVEVPIGPAVKPYGLVKGDHKCYQSKPGKSEFSKSPFYGAFEIRLIPPILDVKDSRRKLPLPCNRAGEETMLHPNHIFGEELPELDGAVMDKVLRDLTDYFSVVLKHEPLGSPSNVDEVLFEGMNSPPGSLHLKGMEVHKGAGLPWTLEANTMKKSQMIQIDEETGFRSFKETEEGRKLRDLCRLKLIRAKNCERVISFCASKLKTNQLLKEKNVVKGKTRVFNSSAVESVICSNSLLVRVKEAILRHRHEFSCAVGMDVHSIDWHQMWQTLLKHEHVFDIDYANYDKRLHGIMMRSAHYLMDKLVQRIDPDCWSNARLVLAEDDIAAFMVDNTSVYQTEHGNKSGTAPTTFVNNLVNLFMVYYVYIKRFGLDVDFSDFKENVTCYFFGDDAVLSVSEKRFPEFNRATVIEELALIGQEATPASKIEGQCDPDSPPEEVTFLKCFPRRFGHFWVAALDKISLEGQFGWSKLQSTDLVDWYEVVSNSLLYAAAHGEEYWTDFRNRLYKKVCSKEFPETLGLHLAPLLMQTYSVMETKLLRKACNAGEFQNDCEASDIRDEIQANGGTLYSWLCTVNLNGLRTSVFDLQTQLTTLGKTVQQIRLDLDNAVTAMDTVVETVDQINLVVSKLDEILQKHEKQLNETGGIVDQLASLKTTVDGNVIAVEKMEQEVSGLGTDVAALQSTADLHDLRIRDLSRTQDAHEKRISALEEGGGADIETRLEAVEKILTFQRPLDCGYVLRQSVYSQWKHQQLDPMVRGFGELAFAADPENPATFNWYVFRQASSPGKDLSDYWLCLLRDRMT